MDARFAAFLDMDWDERIILIRSMGKDEREDHIRKIFSSVKRCEHLLESDKVEDVFNFMAFLDLAD